MSFFLKSKQAGCKSDNNLRCFKMSSADFSFKKKGKNDKNKKALPVKARHKYF